MARDERNPRQKRFSKSGHTSHRRPQYPPDPGYGSGSGPPPSVRSGGPGGPQPGPSDYGAPSYHSTRRLPPTDPANVVGGAGKVSVTRTVLARSNELARDVTRKVIMASQADGARESGLTHLIWNQVLSYGADAMITIALAGTVFFGASPSAQRGNVLLYLLITMAPFAVIAPVIGPTLDRVQHGRRYAMALTALGRALLAVVMASHPTNLYVLYPCALGSLVLSKAYSVIRAAAAPRLVPPQLTLVEANARLSIFGLAAALVGGGFVGLVIKITGSYTAGLMVTAVAFAVTAYFAIQLPKQVDTADRPPPLPRRRDPQGRPLSLPGKLHAWATRGFPPQVITAIQGESLLRFLSGLLTIFIAFYISRTSHGFEAAVGLGLIGVGAGAGNFIGTGVGTRLKLKRPEVVILACVTAGAIACLFTALLFAKPLTILAMFVVCAVNSLGKIANDAIIQRDVPEVLRSSAFGRSETFLQLAWVAGGAIGVLLPPKSGSLGFWVAGSIAGLITIFITLRYRVNRRQAVAQARQRPPGSLASGESRP